MKNSKLRDLEYLSLLSASYPTEAAAATEYINLTAIMNLPKPTECFLSDIHGEYGAFTHFMKSGSGVIRSKIEEALPTIDGVTVDLLSTLIYYPAEKLDDLQKKGELTIEKQGTLIRYLVAITKLIASKYTRSKVRKMMPQECSYIIDELLQCDYATESKERYANEIIKTIVSTGRSRPYIIEICQLIQRMAVDRIHILGDIFDRGNGACRIMEDLSHHDNVDITWGNHDLLYMGASAGNFCCIANVIRNSCRYNHLSTIEDGYGISLRPLVTFALHFYGDDPCTEFIPKIEEANQQIEDYDLSIIAKMHKAITIIQLKAEGKTIAIHHHYEAESLRKLAKVNFTDGTFTEFGVTHKLTDTHFPTIDPNNPEELSKEEQALMEKLSDNFRHSEKMKRHVSFLLSHGSFYLRYNGNLLYHGCVPTNKDGTFFVYHPKDGGAISGKAYFDYCDRKVRQILLSKAMPSHASDFLWYLWCCPNSPLYGKENIATFERYFLTTLEAKTITENKNAYYTLINEESYARRILREFDLDDDGGIIINGHMPVKIKKGESPIKANGKLLIIDGGICKAYQKVTGIAGYTLTSSSHALRLVAHESFESKEVAISQNRDIVNSYQTLQVYSPRRLVKDTDTGEVLAQKAADCLALIHAYEDGQLTPKQ